MVSINCILSRLWSIIKICFLIVILKYNHVKFLYNYKLTEKLLNIRHPSIDIAISFESVGFGTADIWRKKSVCSYSVIAEWYNNGATKSQ